VVWKHLFLPWGFCIRDSAMYQEAAPMVYRGVFHSWDLLSRDHRYNDTRDTHSESFLLTLPKFNQLRSPCRWLLLVRIPMKSFSWKLPGQHICDEGKSQRERTEWEIWTLIFFIGFCYSPAHKKREVFWPTKILGSARWLHSWMLWWQQIEDHW